MLRRRVKFRPNSLHMPDALDLLIRDLKRLSGSAQVGALDEETARKLAFSEFGTVHAPTRPTLSAATDRAERDIFAAVDRKVAAVLTGKSRTGRAIVQDVGADLAEQVREEIGNNVPPPLAASTIRARQRRGNADTRTLVDSGDMQRGIGVESKDGVGTWPDEDEDE